MLIPIVFKEKDTTNLPCRWNGPMMNCGPNTIWYDMIWCDDVACSGRCAYMLGLSVNSVILVEGTLFFIFSFHPSSFPNIFFYICFLSFSFVSSSFPILSPLSSYKFFCSLLLFFGLHLFIFFIHPLLFSLFSFNSNWFSSYFSLF